MRALFVWTGLTGYMGDCWRALQRRLDGSLEIVVVAHPSGVAFEAESVLKDLKARVVPAETRHLEGIEKPDILFAVGWRAPLVRNLVTRSDWADIPKICCFDLPWTPSPRRIAARWVLRPFLRHYTGAYVPGVQAERYAHWLGFGKITTGLFGTDLKRFTIQNETKSGFLFVGRYEPEKGLDLLLRAYALYRAQGGVWPLTCAGAGSLSPLLASRPSVTDLGFVRPEMLGDVYQKAGAFVLPSRSEPWGVVLAEGAGAGLPLVVSSAVGARHELVRDNGLVFRSGSAASLCSALLRAERDKDLQETARSIGPSLAARFNADAWADRTLGIIRDRV